MKTDEQVDAIMNAIPAEWRLRWCGGEYGPCACMGCVQIGNRRVIFDKGTDSHFHGDPEYLSEDKLKQNFAEIYQDNKITHEEWMAWKNRQGKNENNFKTF